MADSWRRFRKKYQHIWFLNLSQLTLEWRIKFSVCTLTPMVWGVWWISWTGLIISTIFSIYYLHLFRYYLNNVLTGAQYHAALMWISVWKFVCLHDHTSHRTECTVRTYHARSIPCFSLWEALLWHSWQLSCCYNSPHTCILMEMVTQSVWLILCYPSDTSVLNYLNHLIVLNYAPGAGAIFFK